jgi:hypothetical protein
MEITCTRHVRVLASRLTLVQSSRAAKGALVRIGWPVSEEQSSGNDIASRFRMNAGRKSMASIILFKLIILHLRRDDDRNSTHCDLSLPNNPSCSPSDAHSEAPATRM